MNKKVLYIFGIICSVLLALLTFSFVFQFFTELSHHFLDVPILLITIPIFLLITITSSLLTHKVMYIKKGN